MHFFDKPLIVRAIDDDGHGQARGLTDASLLVLAQEVIQRLSRIAQGTPIIGQEIDLEGFCIALLEPTPEEAKLILLRAHSMGFTHQELCLAYIGGAAQLLGTWWDQDLISFRDMTLAAGRMLHFLRDLRTLLPVPPLQLRRAALFATVPGEQHILGITMATDIFRGKGWDIDLQIGRSETDLCKMARDGHYPIVGLSASSPDRVRALARTIVELRIAAPLARIFVSGHIAALEPDIAIRAGADAASADIDICAEMLEQLHTSLVVVSARTP